MATASSAAWPGLIDDAYRSVERMIWKIITGYHKKHGGDLEELKSVADLAFTNAVYTWDESKGKFTTHVWNMVRFALMDNRTAELRQKGFINGPGCEADSILVNAEDAHVDLSQVEYKNRTFDLKAFLANLSEEAREMVDVVLGLHSNEEPLNEHKLAEIFQEAGWAASEFLRAFKEIAEAL